MFSATVTLDKLITNPLTKEFYSSVASYMECHAAVEANLICGCV